MSDFRSLTIQSGVVTQIQNANNLIVGAGITTAAGPLTISAFDGYVHLAANKNLVADAGTGKFDFSASTGDFLTSTGNVTLGANTGGSVVIDGSTVAINAATTISESLTSTNTANGFGVAGIVHNDSAGLFTSSKINVGLDVTAGTSGQGLLTRWDGIPTWTTFSQDATVDGYGKITVVSSNGNFEVKGDLTVDGTETIIGTSLFQNNATFDGNVLVDGYNLTVTNGNLTQTGGTVSLTANAASQISTTSGALTLTSAAAATWSTTAGNLTVDAAASLKLGTSTATSVEIGKLGITTTNDGYFTSNQLMTAGSGLTVATGNLTVSGLSTGIAHVDASGVFTSSSISVGTDITGGSDGQFLSTQTATPTWTTLSQDGYLGTGANSGKLTVVSSQGNFAVLNGNLTQTGGTVALTANGASSITTSSGGLTLTAAGASTWSTASGGLTLTSAAAATWSTLAGALTLDGFGGLNLQTNNVTRLAVTDGYVTVQAGVTLDTTGTGNINLPNNGSARFQVEGVSVGSTVTAAALNTLTNGSNADALHVHGEVAATTAHSVTLTGMTTTAIDGYYFGYISADNTFSKAIASSTFAAANVVGVGEIANRVTIGGHCQGIFDSAPTAGQVAYVSPITAGNLTTTAPTTDGYFVTRVGVVMSSVADSGRYDVALGIMAPVAL